MFAWWFGTRREAGRLSRDAATIIETARTASRPTASRHIAALMRDPRIEGPQACPKGLRHAFGVAAVAAGIPLPMIASILGHADIKTTAIGTEARDLIARMWA